MAILSYTRPSKSTKHYHHIIIFFYTWNSWISTLKYAKNQKVYIWEKKMRKWKKIFFYFRKTKKFIYDDWKFFFVRLCTNKYTYINICKRCAKEIFLGIPKNFVRLCTNKYTYINICKRCAKKIFFVRLYTNRNIYI